MVPLDIIFKVLLTSQVYGTARENEGLVRGKIADNVSVSGLQLQKSKATTVFASSNFLRCFLTQIVQGFGRKTL